MMLEKNSIFFKRYTVARWAATISILIITLLISPYYTDGDQALYRKVYQGVANLGIVEGFIYYTLVLRSSEFIHYFIIWSARGFGIEKDFLMASSNAFLVYFSMKLFEKWKVSIFVSMAIVLTNYYLFVMYLAAERLKFGFLILVVSMIYLGQNKRFYLTAVLAVFAHVQMLLIYASMLFERLVNAVIQIFKTSKFTYKNIGISILTMGPMIFVADKIYSKFQFYSMAASEKSLFDLVNIALLFMLSSWYSKNRYRTFLFFTPIILAVFLVGSERINMMGYFVFLYYALQYRKGLNLGVLTTTIYFAFKTYLFIERVIQYGDGFATS